MNKLVKKLKSTKGDIASSLVSLMIITAAFALMLTAVPVFTKLYALNSYMDDVCRYIELSGTTDGIEQSLEDLDAEYFPSGDAPVLDLISGINFIAGTNNIQLGDSFTIKGTITYIFRVSGFFSIPIEISAGSVGRSEVYFK